jgi:serine/threonine protein kinase
MPISSLPKEMEHLDHLVNLDVSNANISDLPNGGGVFRGGIRGIFRAQASSNKPCNHIKLMLICPSDIVKTVMLSKLKPQFNSSQQVPNGSLPEIDIFQWSFKPLFSRKDKIYFNTWLIGSNHSCRSIFPCFFTPSAFYVMVWDMTTTADLREQIKPYIDLLIRYVPSANILTIAVLPEQYERWSTKKAAEGLAAKLNKFFSKPSYQSLSYHGVMTVVASPNSKAGQSDLKQLLYDAAQEMIVNDQQIVGRQIPETYFSLIPALEKEQQTFRSKSKPGVLEESTIWMLFDNALASDPPNKMELPVIVDFLKEAGLLLHYEDPNDRLDRFYFTRPIWLYNTLLRVVRHALEHRSRLFRTHSELCSLANVSWSKDIAQALIRLMIRYAIVLPVHRDQYLIICLLPHFQPPTDILYCGMLRRQFAPKVHSIPIDLWSRLLCSIISNLPRIIDMSKLKRESNNKHVEIPLSEQPDATTGATESRTQKGIKEESPISSTAKDETLASRLLRKTSPVKRFRRSGSPALSDPSQAPPTNSTQVNGQLQASNPRHSSEASRLRRHVGAPTKKRELSRYSEYSKLATIDIGVEIWDSGMIYNHDGIRFSIYPCISEVSTIEERGIEICCTRDNYGYTIMARLCWLVQRNLEERFPYLFSAETPLQKHELTQIAICPTCLERNERSPSCFLIEACIHPLQLKGEHNCRYHPEAIPLRDLVPDYLLHDYPSHLHLTKTMFEYNEAKPLHHGRQTVLYNGHFNGKKVAIKMYHQVDTRSITLPLSCVRRETDMLSSLNHPNIFKIFGFCLDPPCVLVEKAPLGNLYQKLMDTEVKISRTVRFHIACQVASALSYLHRRDIIYRTLKASSILLWSLDFNCDASVKLTNFERAAYQSRSGGLMSKTTFFSYSAPEMLRYSFREEYTEKVDIYSFGILLYELVTRWQPYGGTSNGAHSQKPKLSGVMTTSYSTIVKLMEECWQEESLSRPSADGLLLQLSQPSFQCHLASQVLHDFFSVRGCCFVPSVRQIWVYGDYNRASLYGEEEISDGTRVFILNAENLTVQGSFELRERATAMCIVDNKVWIGMLELCVHAYDTTTFRFTDQFHLNDAATIIADNDCYVFVGQVNGQLKCYSKLQLQRGVSQPVVMEIGDKAIITMVTVGDIIWIGCGNELVILSADYGDEIVIELRADVCESSDNVYAMAVSHNTNTVWCITRNSHRITSFNLHTTELKQTVDLSEHLKWICCEENYDPSTVRMVSIECVSDTLWVGLSCGVIMVLSDTEQPEKIVHFKAHKQATKCLLKIPHSNELHQQHEYSLILSGGFGEVSSLSSTASEQNGVVMLWQACTANEFSTISKRHNNYCSGLTV